MWHALGLFLLVGFGPPLSDAQLFSEGNGRAWPPASAAAADEMLASMDAAQLAAIVEELRALRNAEQLERDPYQLFEAEAPLDRRYPNEEELAKFGRDFEAFQRDEAAAAAHEANVDEYVNAEVAPAADARPATAASAASEENRARPAAQKKGQFEFVEFVEPHHAKALKSVEYLDKRAPIASFSDDAIGGSGRRLIFGSNNVLFLVAVTVGSVATVVGVVGGGYYLNTVRKQRAEAFDDFTRYSPSGPGRDMLRKGRGFAGSPISDVHGDDALAKAAHLHHYAQTKQKIIGEDNGVHDDEHTDDEADDLEEQNYSIYECPGLAPTSGDIEVTNPNFAAQQP